MILITGLILLITGCSKEAFLNEKPDQSLVIPSTLRDYQAILDNEMAMNGILYGRGIVPAMGEAGTDNYTVSQNYFENYMRLYWQNCMLWADRIYTDEAVWDWIAPYVSVYYANTALEGIEKITPQPAEIEAWNNIKGSSLFYRAHQFYQLAQVFAPPYDKQTASSQWGIPLRLTPTVTEEINRATLEETYRKVIDDLLEAREFLPEKPLYKTRPCKTAVNALLARVYQTMEIYDSALVYADAALAEHSSLLDYNTLDTISNISFPIFSDEVIFNATMIDPPAAGYPINLGVVDSAFLASYGPDDLRVACLFLDFGYGPTPSGGLSGGYSYFAGIATDELYLIKSESLARMDQVPEAMDALNTLLEKRWRTNSFAPFNATTEDEALNIILTERRKELCFRGLRWTDLRRLNKDSRFAKTLRRYQNDQWYTLPPNDPRYTYPIPDDVIKFNSAMPQNPR